MADEFDLAEREYAGSPSDIAANLLGNDYRDFTRSPAEDDIITNVTVATSNEYSDIQYTNPAEYFRQMAKLLGQKGDALKLAASMVYAPVHVQLKYLDQVEDRELFLANKKNCRRFLADAANVEIEKARPKTTGPTPDAAATTHLMRCKGVIANLSAKITPPIAQPGA